MTGSVRFDLGGKRALVTGGASGIGLAVCESLAENGCLVGLNDLENRDWEALEQRFSQYAPGMIALPGDIGDRLAAEAVVERAVAEMGGLDYLVNNAGTPNTKRQIPASRLEAMDEAFWQRILSVNLLAPFWLTRAAASTLRENAGAVVNTVSMAAYHGGGSSLAYSVSKSGLVGLTRELARGLAPEVRVNGIAPGLVDSPWDCGFGDMQATAQASVALKRVGQPEDYAENIIYLLAGAQYITGEVIMVTGGYDL